MQKTFTVVSGLLSLFITTPIWYYLVYKLLESAHATELMWFLFWIYLPVGIFCGIVTKFAQPKA